MHIQFTSLSQFNAVFKGQTWEGLAQRIAVAYVAKIKLHGTNMSISTQGGVAQTQSRKNIFTRDNDFYTFAETLEDDIARFAAASGDVRTTFYGEWAGPGIGKGDAIQQTDKKRFFLFAVGIGARAHPQDDTLTVPEFFITDPDSIEAMLPDGLDRDRIRVLPVAFTTTIDFNNEVGAQATIDVINARVDEIGDEDLYVKTEFGVSAGGEGYVLAPLGTCDAPIAYNDYARQTFKAKTEKHRVRKQGKAASAREPLPQSAVDFVETYVTDARVEQAMFETGASDVKDTGKVIGWITKDVQKEGAEELADMGLQFFRIKGDVAKAARLLFHAKI